MTNTIMSKKLSQITIIIFSLCAMLFMNHAIAGVYAGIDAGIDPNKHGKVADSNKHSSLYYSKVKIRKGSKVRKGYYSCPKNFKRTSPTRKMNHPKACVNRKGKNQYKKAKYRGRFKDKCPKLRPTKMYKVDGSCVSCPLGTELSRVNNGHDIRAYKCVSKAMKLKKKISNRTNKGN